MPGSGITLSSDLTQKWNSLRSDVSVTYVKFVIVDDERFDIAESSTTEDPITAARNGLAEKEPSYAVVRSKEDNTKFHILFYVPLNSRVAKKMIYSSSLSALKLGLGTDYLISELYLTEAKECTPEAIANSTKSIEKYNLLTQQEQLQHASAYSSVGTLETHSKISVDLPVKVSNDAQNALNQLQSGAISTVLFGLHIETEVLEVLEQGNLSLDEVQQKLTPTQPAYIFSRFSHQHPETQETVVNNIFIYYCPNKAPLKQKMFFSSAKSIVVKILEQHNLAKESGYEANEPTEISIEEALKTIYPPTTERKKFSKPLPPNRRRK